MRDIKQEVIANEDDKWNEAIDHSLEIAEFEIEVPSGQHDQEVKPELTIDEPFCQEQR